MRALLDTHTALWFFDDVDKLSSKAYSVINNEENDIFVSIASVWEVAIKVNLGKLKCPGNTAGFLRMIYDNGFSILNIAPHYLLELEKLPNHHKDPFDRLLAATAIAENIPVITTDENIPRYSVECIW
ncbi:MAG: type II toxin-antitoxin system VapC family toxin [Treponematales bacterium]